MYFVISGQVRLEKQVSFIRSKINGRQVVFPDKGEALEPKSERFQEILSLGTLDPSDSFPEPFPMGIMKDPNHHKFDKVALMSKVSDMDALGQNLPFVNCVALKPTVCLVIERVEFFRLMSTSMRQQLMDASKIYQISVEQMQHEWILAKGWQSYKKQMVESVLNDVKQHKALVKIQLEQEINQYHS